MIRHIYAFFLFSFIFSSVNAQLPATSGQARQSGSVYGKITDNKSKKGIDGVSVVLIKKMYDSASAATKDSVLAGVFSGRNGDFVIENVPVTDSLLLLITPVGYKKIERDVYLSSALEGGIDLGNFAIEPDATELGNVVVTASRPTMQMGIDRRVINVDQNITATGGTAVDVMRTIPSVTVDVEGNVQLRNAAPQIFIDGRPTILTLDQIPADNIDKVELITNPSAAFDAASSGGIINVVLKKNRRIGLNGTTSVSAGTPGILAGNLTLNLRQGKFNFFVSGNYNQSGGKAKGETFRQNKRNGVITDYFNQFSNNDRTRRFASVRFGIDYFLNNRNTITITQNLVDGKFTNDELQRQEYLTAFRQLESTGLRTSASNSNFNRSNTQLLYTHKFKTTGHQLTADVNYNNGSNDNLTNIINSYYNIDGNITTPANRVRNDGATDSKQLTVQADYVNPIGENKKIEFGLRSFYESNSSVYNAFAIGQSGTETKLPLSNQYEFSQRINAGYFTFSNKIKTFTYQAGLRAETSKFEGELTDRGQSFGYEYPAKLKNIWDALFPSLFLTKALSEKADLQLNYSRRIRRPNFWQLNPFIDISDPVNLRQGNPALRPEFTNSYELNFNKTYRGGNFLGSLYFRNTTGDITEYSDTLSAEQYNQLDNAAINPNAILNTYINSKNQDRWGLDLTLQQKLAKNFEIVPNVNLQYRKVNAAVGKQNLSNEGFNWEAKLVVNYKIEAPQSWLFNNLGFQLTGEYESPEVIPQGKRKEQYGVDFALRKEMFKDKKGNLVFAVNDVFNSRRWGTIYDTDNFYQDSYRRWNVRSFRLTFSYRFGSSKFSLFKRSEKPAETNDEPGMQGG